MHVLLSLAFPGAARAAATAAAGLALALLLALAFAVASVLTVFYGVVPGGHPPAPTGNSPTTVPIIADGAAADAVAVARGVAGAPYVWGGASPAVGFDCSGLVQWAYGRVGVRLPRTAQQQYDATARVPLDQVRPGDLLFYANTYKVDPSEPITHVGIYVGDGRMLNAPVEGDVVREMPAFTGFWGAHLAGAGRPIGGRP